MSQTTGDSLSRRELLRKSGQVAVASTLASMAIPHVHAAEDNTIRVALIGCGGRGTGAAGDALSTTQGPTKLVAMADVFEDRLSSSYDHLVKDHGTKIEVKKENKFVGFDAYKKAMDCLRPGDVVIMATPPAFRWVHFTYAIEKGLHTFMEKPISVDGPTTRRMLKLAEDSRAHGAHDSRQHLADVLRPGRHLEPEQARVRIVDVDTVCL